MSETDPTDPYLGEIRMYGFSFAPHLWAKCDGQLLPIIQFEALYTLIGTTYGGDGRTSFALPDLRGRSPLHSGEIVPLGSTRGVENVVLEPDNLPPHFHQVNARGIPPETNNPTDNILAKAAVYSESTTLEPMADLTVGFTGGGQAHNNMQPYLVINFCISLTGQFPPRN